MYSTYYFLLIIFIYHQCLPSIHSKILNKRFDDNLLRPYASPGGPQKFKVGRGPQLPKKSRATVMIEKREEIMKLIMTQSSSENAGWRPAHTKLFAILEKNISVETCQTQQNPNYVQYQKYLNNRRQQYLKSKPEDEPSVLIGRSTEFIEFFILFNQTSKYGFKSESLWHVIAKEFNEKTDEWRIVSLKEGGACIQHGVFDKKLIHKEHVDVGYLVDVPDGKAFGKKMIEEAAVGGVDEWEKYFEKGAYFEGKVHNNPDIKYGPDKFLKYLEYFLQRWKVNGKEGMRFAAESMQDIVDSPDTYLFRYRMVLRLREDSDEEEWNLMIQAKYNTHGNNRWAVNKAELISPVGVGDDRPLRNKYADDLAAKLVSGLQGAMQNSGNWFEAYDFVRKFSIRDDNVELILCNRKSVNNKTYGYRLWADNMNINITGSTAFKLMTPGNVEGDVLKFTIRTMMVEESMKVQSYDWKFEYKYDKDIDYWWLDVLDVSCPFTTGKANGKRELRNEEYYKYEVHPVEGIVNPFVI